MPIGMVLTWLSLLSLLSIAAQRVDSSERPWLDPRAPPDVRAAMLLGRMTQAEKVAQTLHLWKVKFTELTQNLQVDPAV